MDRIMPPNETPHFLADIRIFDLFVMEPLIPLEKDRNK